MNSIGAAYNGSAYNPIHTQVTFRRGCRADTDRLVRQLGVKSFLVGLRVNRNRLNSHFPAGTDNPHCYLAAVGN